ncbi:CBS domain-containing protein [Candidatus Oleimmundimicrobium sp.]|uniref:CBS domain-containing protein n=1 Tax=Candidatus Oleimmundimicrobium sp. TaxID=3060597 RepID=UPI0027273E19|nr:CBS domain-containing protein [Candidatus Oleimmundimicrobium sp.]MDO8886396.1 CBS domain-containing protein [Candidatus Oleimmundimicrobium sp.]
MNRLPHAEVKEIMKKNVITVNENNSLDELADKFRKYNFHGFPVVDDEGKLSGIVTKKDLLKIYRRQNLQSVFADQVRDIMVSPVVTVSPDNTISDVIDVMFEHAKRILPVVDDGKLVGMICQRDIVIKILAKEPKKKSQKSMISKLTKRIIPTRKK